MESQSFSYTAIPQGRCLRLLKIHPGSEDDELVCDLFAADLDTTPSYTALSYVWGDPTKSADLICSGHACKITRSLAEGLRRIRKVDQVEIAWADAICINQNDNIEKGHQVDLMGVIYASARDVLVWLGADTTDSSHEAFRCLRTINEKLYTRTDQEWYIPTKEESPIHSVSVTSASGQTINMSAPTARRSVLGFVLGEFGKECVGRLFELSWFSRVWVLQEVGVATAAIAFWGDFSIDFSEIAAFIYNVYFEEDLKYFLEPEISTALAGAPLYALWNVWSTYEKKDSWMHRTPVLRAFAQQLAVHSDLDFTLVLEASRYFNATNTLDHVYAFLGHPKAKKPGSEKTWLQANYSLTVKEQHCLLASSLAQDSLNFLVQVEQTPESLEADFEHPSWIPRWNEKGSFHADAFWEAWDASLRKTERQPFRAQVDGNKLGVSALVIDSIDQFTATMEKAGFEPIDDAGGRLVEQCWDVAMQKPCPYTRKEAVTAFASTLLCEYKKGSQHSQSPSAVEQLAGFCMRANVAFYKDLERTNGLWTLDTTLRAGKMFGPTFKGYATNRRFFSTQSGGWGLGPAAMQHGDVCAVLFGADVPVVLRPMDARGEYKLVGECYMYKFMDGEAVLAWREGQQDYVKQDVVLV
ncbi:hypothetical protein FZEAL_258 [Fusarium zealandicum]|uniref:Heterokaryon incompatibility domain-containing protein n=1 Tax=Fusarium zealandicum TaxID=1053134 RepID=A0A8H4XQK8_9HYPO|nr:hypothetical protein FZEAL_258 [Fusarium zealandicum]